LNRTFLFATTPRSLTLTSPASCLEVTTAITLDMFDFVFTPKCMKDCLKTAWIELSDHFTPNDRDYRSAPQLSRESSWFYSDTGKLCTTLKIAGKIIRCMTGLRCISLHLQRLLVAALIHIKLSTVLGYDLNDEIVCTGMDYSNKTHFFSHLNFQNNMHQLALFDKRVICSRTNFYINKSKHIYTHVCPHLLTHLFFISLAGLFPECLQPAHTCQWISLRHTYFRFRLVNTLTNTHTHTLESAHISLSWSWPSFHGDRDRVCCCLPILRTHPCLTEQRDGETGSEVEKWR